MTTLYALLQSIGLAPKAPREPLYKHVLRALPTLVIVTSIMLLLEHLGWLKGFETTALDAWLLAKSAPPSSNVVIVTIDNQDYRDLFGGRSPIDADKLHELLVAVAAGKPRVIGVDIDTSAPEFAGRQWPDAVWARDAEPVSDESSEPPDGDAHHGTGDMLRFSILGGDMRDEQSGDAIKTSPKSGLVVFPQDYDGVVRRYRRTYYSDKAEPPADVKGYVDTLPWAVAKQYAARTRAIQPQDCAECDRIESLERQRHAHELVLNFAGDRYRFNRIAARNVLAGASKEFWTTNAPVRDTIVLVGGAYRAARDEYITPVGPMYGVELIAQAIESDLLGGGIRDVNRAIATLLDFAMGIVLVYLNWRFPSRFTATITLLAIIVLSLLGSYLAFHALAYWFNFTAVLVGIWIHTLWEQSQERRKLRHEVETLRARLTGHGA